MSETVLRAIQALTKPALCLDFDGTLVEIAPRPEAIRVDACLQGLLEDLRQRFDGRVALITGRSHVDLSRYLDLIEFPVSASHGAQFSAAGAPDAQTLGDPAALDDWRELLSGAIAGHEAVYLEDKGTAIAVHTRPNPQAHDGLLKTLKAHASADVHVAGGKGIVEVRLASEDKGTAIDRLMALPNWQGACPVMIGDDTTDNDGMAAAKRHGGLGVQVGAGPGGNALSHATYAVMSVADVHAMLAELAR